MSAALSFDGVQKAFGKAVALDRLSFEVPSGSLCGLVGPNGAGKTTAFSIVSGILQPDAGAMVVLGQEGFDVWRLKGRLGVLPQDADLGLRHTPTELLVHLGRLQGLSASDARTDTARVLELEDRKGSLLECFVVVRRSQYALECRLDGFPVRWPDRSSNGDDGL